MRSKAGMSAGDPVRQWCWRLTVYFGERFKQRLNVTRKAIKQSELGFEPGKAQAISGRTKAIQDLLLDEGLKAVKLSENCRSMDELKENLFAELGQNSQETRRRYSQSVLHWFLKDGLNGLLPNVWRTYKDEAIVNDLLRWSYLA